MSPDELAHLKSMAAYERALKLAGDLWGAGKISVDDMLTLHEAISVVAATNYKVGVETERRIRGDHRRAA